MPIRDPIAALTACFRDPPAAYRPVPQWSWNGDLTRHRILEQLQQFVAQGCGGLFAHARPGHINGYMSDKYLALWQYALEEAARLGMAFHIYDEFMCPAGHAGGLVTGQRPHLAVQELTLALWTGQGRRPPGAIAALLPAISTATGQPPASSRSASAATSNSYAIVPVSDIEPPSPGVPVPLLTIEAQPARPGFGYHPFPDLLRRETAAAFLSSTHERYAAACGEHFGTAYDDGPGATDRGVRFMFSDEPELVSSGGLPLSPELLATFWRDHGYDLEDHLLELALGAEGAEPIRFDYWWTVNRLFNEAFMQPVARWCEDHRLLFTGHLMEHEWPSPRSHPSAMAALRWMHAPGTDLLGFQFAPTTPQENGLYLMNLVEVRSVRRQLGREWMLVESCGGGGYDKAFDLFKPLEDLVLAFEFNVIDPHLSAQSLAGMRKYDWPQTLSDHSSWWPYYRQQADHVARVNAAFGQRASQVPSSTPRVLLLHPTTTGWLHYTAPVFAPYDPDGEAEMASLRESQIALTLAMLGSQIDVDLGDEFILAELGRVEEDHLTIGASRYAAVVLPAAMETWTATTLARLTTYLEAGGHLYTLRRNDGTAAPARVDGRLSQGPADLEVRFPAQWHVYARLDDLVFALREAVPPQISGPEDAPLPQSLVWRQEAIDTGVWLTFFCNPWRDAIVADVQLPGRYLAALDTTAGDVKAAPAGPVVSAGQSSVTDRGDATHTLIAHLELPPRGHALWLTSLRPLTGERPAVMSITATTKPVNLVLTSVERLKPNLLMLDYCDLEANGHSLTGAHVMHADSANWHWQGFDANPWRQAHQFRRTTIDRPINPERSFQVSYRFALDAALPDRARSGLQVGIERPWLYEVTLNGHPLDVEGAPRWFDEDARAVAIGDRALHDENLLTLSANPFHTLCEIMPVYLIGDFAALPGIQGFRAAVAGPLALGDWTQMGMPFYSGAVRYTFTFSLDADTGDLDLAIPSWEGTIVAVGFDGTEIGTIAHPPFRLALPSAAAGVHTLALDVIGNMRNTMGPHHADGLPGSWTWERSPRHQPPGTAYRAMPSGLLAMPTLNAS